MCADTLSSLKPNQGHGGKACCVVLRVPKGQQDPDVDLGRLRRAKLTQRRCMQWMRLNRLIWHDIGPGLSAFRQLSRRHCSSPAQL